MDKHNKLMQAIDLHLLLSTTK